MVPFPAMISLPALWIFGILRGFGQDGIARLGDFGGLCWCLSANLTRQHRILRTCLGAIFVIAHGGCTRTEHEDLPPSTILTRIAEAWETRNLQQIADHATPDSRDELLETLLAIDAFLVANDALCDWVRVEIGQGAAASIDQRHLASAMGPFADGVSLTLLETYIDADVAQVSYTVDGKLPARRAAFRRIDQQWRYDPYGLDAEDRETIPRLAPALSRMANGLNDLRILLERNPDEAATLRRQPEQLLERTRHALQPGVELLKPRNAPPTTDN